MSVIFVSNSDFHGFLVRRTCNKQVKSQYFGLSRTATAKEKAKVEKAAKTHDAELADWQKEEKAKLVAKAVPTVRSNTGVRGISYGEIVDKKNGVRYVQIGFKVSCTGQDGKSVNRNFPVKSKFRSKEFKAEYEGAWSNAAACLGEAKGFDGATLKGRIPKPAQYYKKVGS